MSFSLRSTLGTFVAAAAFTVALGAASAHASSDRDMVRDAQMHLADLGYFSGVYDGILGPDTKSALRDFQRNNGLYANGNLSTLTYDRLIAADNQISSRSMAGHAYSSQMAGYAYPYQMVGYAYPYQVNPWHFAATANLPARFAAVTVDEEDNGSLRRYTVKLNGVPVLLADRQLERLKISGVFQLDKEDAFLVTSYRGEDTCAYRNTLITIHDNGSYAQKDFTSCAMSSDVRMANNALFIRFAETMNRDGYDMWDVWRYENTQLIRL